MLSRNSLDSILATIACSAFLEWYHHSRHEEARRVAGEGFGPWMIGAELAGSRPSIPGTLQAQADLVVRWNAFAFPALENDTIDCLRRLRRSRLAVYRLAAFVNRGTMSATPEAPKTVNEAEPAIPDHPEVDVEAEVGDRTAFVSN